MTRMPQTMINVANVDKAAAKTHPEVLAAVADTENDLGGKGRVLLRPSGAGGGARDGRGRKPRGSDTKLKRSSKWSSSTCV